MTNLLQEKCIRERRDSRNCVYLLDNNDLYSSLGFKVLQSRKVSSLLNAARVMHNGHLEFIYYTAGLEQYSSVLASLPPDGSLMLCTRIIEAVMKVERQGFLNCENIDLSSDRLYFDPRTYEARLVYLPLSARDENRELEVEEQLRKTLCEIITHSRGSAGGRQKDILEALRSGNGKGLSGILRLFDSGAEENTVSMPVPGVPVFSSLVLRSMNTDMPVSYKMQSGHIRIGRRSDNDLVLDFTSQISRYHCKIWKTENAFYIQDEGSKYGTKLNNRLLTPREPVMLKNQDIVSLPRINIRVCLS